MSRVELVATGATPTRFRSIAAPVVAALEQQEDAIGCTGG
jgi:hypothetical protein